MGSDCCGFPKHIRHPIAQNILWVPAMLDPWNRLQVGLAAPCGAGRIRSDLGQSLLHLVNLKQSEKSWLNQQQKLWVYQQLWFHQQKLWLNQQKLWVNQPQLWVYQQQLWLNQQKMWFNQNMWFNQQKMWLNLQSMWLNQQQLWFNQQKKSDWISKTCDFQWFDMI